MAKLLLWVAVLLAFPIVAANSQPEEPKFSLGLSVLDYPFVTSHGFTFPSMDQSLALSNDFYQAVNYGVERAAGGENSFWSKLAVIGVDYLSTWTPLSYTWLHEEWHRAVMSKHQVSSYNGVYQLPFFKSLISVTDVTDDDLARLKRESPADFVRLASAGIEANYEQVFALEKEAFFFESRPWNLPIYWQAYVGNIAYLFICASDQANRITDTANDEEGATISNRDFTGLDCTAWSYDLHRPDEAYSVRGLHPSGVGINRYRKFSDLNQSERNFLELQGYLSLLNLLDPNLLGFESFGGETQWNTTLRHHLTSFGYTIDFNLFWKRPPWNLLVISHHYVNGEKYFPGIEVQWLRYPIQALGREAYLSPRLMLWLQPKGQRFATSEALLGGLLGVRYAVVLSKQLETYADLEWKSEGWVAGNVYLEPNLSVRLGMSYRFF